MGGLTPSAWWSFEETSGTTALDNGGNHNGTYMNYSPSGAYSGAIAGDTSHQYAAYFSGPDSGPAPLDAGNYTGPYVSVPDSDVLSLTKAYDSFDRVDSNGSWGTADQGGAWTAVFTTSSSYYAVSNHQGTISETAFATWGQYLSYSIADTDVQTKVNWSACAAGGVLQPGAIMARFQDSSNYYRAELRNNSDATIDLRISKTVGDSTTDLATATNIGSCSGSATYYIRFQLNGTTLRAKAWEELGTQPINWNVSTTDSTFSSGYVGFRSSNSATGQTSQPTIHADDFRVQSVGMSVHAWIKPSTFTFAGTTSLLCGDGGTVSANYVHWMGKHGVNTDCEWIFRIYPDTAYEVCPPGSAKSGSTQDRRRRVSSYMFSLDGHLGAGAYMQDASTQAGAWMNVVAVYDPGDYLDTTAGVSLYVNGQPTQKTAEDGGTSPSGIHYHESAWDITPLRGIAPVLIGATKPDSTWDQFQGYIDEVAVFDRKLTDTEIANLFSYAQ